MRFIGGGRSTASGRLLRYSTRLRLSREQADTRAVSDRGHSMRHPILIVLAWSLLTFVTFDYATADEPVVIPETLQRIAAEQNVASRLGIKWEAANPTNAGQYMGMLAAASIVAQTIAERNGRKSPTRDDYLAGLASLCLWPPNKPPVLTSEDHQRLYPAFYSAKLRQSVPKAVGQAAVGLPDSISGSAAALAVVSAVFPKTRDDYLKSVFNPDALR